MTREVGIAGAAALVLLACGSILPESKCPSGSYQCSGNVLQRCYADEFLGGAYWHNVQTCAPSQVCRTEGIAPSEPGCFDPNAYCPHQGDTTCMLVVPSDPLQRPDSQLWKCELRSSDQTIRWSMTSCSGQVPEAYCLTDIATQPEVSACYPVVRNCPGSLAPTHCEANVLFECTGPSLIDNKAVFDWQTTDCTVGGTVCKTVAGVTACFPP